MYSRLICNLVIKCFGSTSENLAQSLVEGIRTGIRSPLVLPICCRFKRAREIALIDMARLYQSHRILHRNYYDELAMRVK